MRAPAAPCQLTDPALACPCLLLVFSGGRVPGAVRPRTARRGGTLPLRLRALLHCRWVAAQTQHQKGGTMSRRMHPLLGHCGERLAPLPAAAHLLSGRALTPCVVLAPFAPARPLPGRPDCGAGLPARPGRVVRPAAVLRGAGCGDGPGAEVRRVLAARFIEWVYAWHWATVPAFSSPGTGSRMFLLNHPRAECSGVGCTAAHAC